ncbi:MAG: hypothetical protein Q7S40_05770 [Opitutaceae bacterium]|nr:hypothetical protein [Opitutaceae bacterium]
MRDAHALNVQPARLKLVRADRSAPFASFVPTSLPEDITADEVAIMNQLEMTAHVTPGQILKVIDTSPPPAAGAGPGYAQPAYPYPQTGYPQPPYPPQGYPPQGYPPQSYPPPQGYPPSYPQPYPPSAPNYPPSYPNHPPQSPPATQPNWPR